MKRIFFLFIITISLFSCDFFVNELPWSTGYFLESPGNVSNISKSYNDEGNILILDWEPIPRTQTYSINYEIYPNGSGVSVYSDTLDTASFQSDLQLDLSSLLSNGGDLGSTIIVTILCKNNVGDGVISSNYTFYPFGNGTASDPYRIINGSSFFDFISDNALNSSGNFALLVNEIDLGLWNTNYNLLSTIDGNGNSISFSSNSNNVYRGLFGYIESSGIFKNSTVNGTLTNCDEWSAILCGQNQGTISNCEINGSIQGTGDNISAVAAHNNGGTISDTTSINVDINATSTYVSGFVSYNDISSSIINCDVQGGTITAANYASGFVARNNSGTITDSTASGVTVQGTNYVSGFISEIVGGTISGGRAISNTVQGTNYVSGFISISYSSTGSTISNCQVQNGVVGGIDYISGFIGEINSDASSSTDISNSSTSATVNGTGTWTGGFLGYCNHGGATAPTLIDSSSASGQVKGSGFTGGFVGYAQGANLRITNSVSNGDVIPESSSGRYGGFAGSIEFSTIQNCYSYGNLDTNSTDSGQFAGYKDSLNITSSVGYGILTINGTITSQQWP